MFHLRIASVAVLSLATAWPSPERFQPLITACEGVNDLGECDAAMTGACKTHDDGERSCGHHHGHHDGGHHRDHEHHDGHHHGGHHHDHEHHDWHHDGHHDGGHHGHGGWGPRNIGDCEGKDDGESCTVSRPGQCVPTGKCPIFKGETACRANDAHPPQWVMDICAGKSEGDDCEVHSRTGTCKKRQYLDFMTCKVEWGPLTMQVDAEVPAITV